VNQPTSKDPGTIIVNGTNLHATYDWKRPADCMPAVTVKGSCDTLTVEISNPAPNKPITGTVTYGALTKPFSIGTDGKATLTFAAGPDKSTSVSFPDYADALTLDAVFPRADTCVIPTVQPSPSDGLADTGTHAGGVAGTGALLIVAGLLLVFVVTRHVGRRRRRTS
jgi:hypothetical protein